MLRVLMKAEVWSRGWIQRLLQPGTQYVSFPPAEFLELRGHDRGLTLKDPNNAAANETVGNSIVGSSCDAEQGRRQLGRWRSVL